MAIVWQYSDYLEKSDPAERLAQLRKHEHEVSDWLRSPVSHSVGGDNMSRETMVAYLRDLKAEREQLEKRTGARKPFGVFGVRFGK